MFGEPFGAADRIDLPAVPLAVVRHTGVRMDQLASLFDRTFQALGEQFATGGLVPNGPAVAIYRGDPAATLDLEIGCPVVATPGEPIAAEDLTIVASVLPSGPALASTHLGSYDGLADAWGGLAAQATQQRAALSGVWIESYVSDPSNTPVEQLRTDLLLPLSSQ